MGAEARQPDEFLLRDQSIDQLFDALDMPIARLGEVAMERHLVLVPGEPRLVKSHEQQAAEFFGRTLFPSPLKPAS